MKLTADCCHPTALADQDKLHDAVVFKRFSEILAKARSNRTSAPGSSSNSETELQEFEQILEAARTHGLNDAELEGATQAKLAKARRRRETTAPAARTTRKGAATRRAPRESVASSNGAEDM